MVRGMSFFDDSARGSVDREGKERRRKILRYLSHCDVDFFKSQTL